MQKQLENISIDDAVLVQRCRQADSEAMARLIVKYQDRVFNIILKICGNRDDAAELTQETFVKVIEKIDSFKGNSTFYTWLFRVAVNLTFNHCRRKVKLGMQSLDEPRGPQAGDAAAQLSACLADERAPDPAAVIQNNEAVEILLKALGALDDEHKAIIVLRDIEGMAYSEIAQTLGIELGTVKSRLSRARATLRDTLKTVLE